MRPSFLVCLNFTFNRSIKGIEVGVRYGDNAVSMLKGHPNLYLYLVDSYKETDCPTAYEKTIDNLKPYSSRVRLIVDESVKAAAAFPDKFFDYVYIDGDHTLDGVNRDLDAWFPKVKDNGIFAGHDYWEKNVCSAVQRFVRKKDDSYLFVIDDLESAIMRDWFFIKRSKHV